ncbi:Xre family transcriptional regulator [Nitrosospira sp. Nsp5]|uniref:Transcriptional regulator, XRE family n=1 Tax=Nitrosospira multiformis TaxID=1231 RepID=A0ABY0TMU9_9PROT|nr:MULTISPECIES: transcriptional regulator [Nitrosospira]PTR05616.1 Xre family transcriptional regulator [Nitrosospira sp. Nsp5]SDR11203.1 transcriptional regulator, XRE family [Nitrosospira multiformis]
MARNFIYKDIFFTNVLRILDERKMTQKELAERAGISTAFISDIAKGQGNPSILTMEAISIALDVSLPILLDTTDLDTRSLNDLAGGKAPQSLPPGYKRISAVLTDYQAYLATEWDAANRKKLRGPFAPRKHNKVV